MGRYSVTVDQVATGAVANTFAGLVGIKLANTTGHRARLRRLFVGGASGAAQDLQVSIKVQRTNNTTDGTSTAVNVNTIGSERPSSVASVVTAIGETYTVEPTTYENGVVAGGSFNTRGGLLLEWGPGEGPEWGINQTLVVRGAPGSASAANLLVEADWDEGF